MIGNACGSRNRNARLLPIPAILVAIFLLHSACRVFVPAPGAGGGIVPGALPPRSLPRDFSLLPPLERYSPDDLWKKINGAADLFLGYGFRELLAVNYTRPRAELPEIEVSLYEMGSALNALGVYLAERSEDVEPLPIGWEAYQTESGLFFHKGPYYVKIVDLSENASLGPVVRDVAERLAGGIEVARRSVPEMDVFPPEGLVEGSVLYVHSDALGHGFLKRVFKAEYEVAGETVTLFYCRQKDADPLLPKYRQYGKEFGKIEREWEESGLQLLSITAFGNPELVFARTDVFGGVLGCPDRGKSIELIRALLANIDRELGKRL